MKTFTTDENYEQSQCQTDLIGEIVKIDELESDAGPNTLVRHLVAVRDWDCGVFYATLWLHPSEMRFSVSDMIKVSGGRTRLESGDNWIAIKGGISSRVMVDAEELSLDIGDYEKVELFVPPVSPALAASE